MKKYNLGLLVLASFGCSLALSQVSLAKTVTITGDNGRSVTTQQNVTRDGNTIDINRTTTLPNGQTVNNSDSFTRNGNNGYTETVSHTNHQGETKTYELTNQHSYSDGTFQNSYTLTGPNGKQSSISNTVSCDRGQCTRQEQYAYPNGQTRTVDYTSQRVGRRGWTGTETITGRNGRQHTFNFVRFR